MNTEEKQTQLVPFKFNSLSEALADNHFKSFVRINIEEFRKQRRERPRLTNGYYKRNWYDRMVESGTFNEDYFVNNINDILHKSSSLTAEIRKVIQSVCEKSIDQTCKFYTENPTVKK